MLDRSNDWEPLDRARFGYLDRGRGMRPQPDRPMRMPGPGLRPVPVDRVIRAIRQAAG